MNEDKDLNSIVSDILISRPYSFALDGRCFSLYPMSLGKIYLLQKQIENLDINNENLNKNFIVEALRVVKEKRSACLDVIVTQTCRGYDEVFDFVLTNERKAFFDKNMSDDDIATLMITVLTADKTNEVMKHLGIDKEQVRMSKVMEIKTKSDKNSITFGGKSQFGTLIDSACERYGWTKEYVVWGIDYTSLRLMLADKVNSVYCTDEELSQIPANLRSSETIKVTKESMDMIRQMDWR